MDNRYATLSVLAGIVQEVSQATQYACTPHEMILHSTFDWDLIHKHLTALAEEGLVVISPADNMQFSITHAGIDKAGAEQKAIRSLSMQFTEQSLIK